MREEQVRKLSKVLFDIGAIRFGHFILTSGLESPFYVDLRIIPSYPDVFDFITDLYIESIADSKTEFHRIAGVPTAGIPISALIAYKMKKPLIYLRKETKGHGLRKLIEGVYEIGDKVIIVDDIATTGKSVLESAEKLRQEKLKVEHAFVLIDREQGAVERLKKEGITLHYYAKITDIINILYDSKCINKEKYDEVINYLKGD